MMIMKLFMLTSIAAILFLAAFVRAGDKKIVVNVDVPSDQDRNQSYIIIDAEEVHSAEKGHSISVPISIYRGSTLKRTVYVWIEDEDKNIITSKSKFSPANRFTLYNFSANLTFTNCPKSNGFRIVAEGLGLNVTKDVDLDFIGCASDTYVDGSVSFDILRHESEVESGKSFKTSILISNPTGKYLEVSASSYVYRSSKCYSGEREGNKKTINLPAFSNVTFDLENTVIAAEGDYTLKIKLLPSDRKTPKEFTFQISVKGNVSGIEKIVKDQKTPLVSSVSGNNKSSLNASKEQLRRKLVTGNVSSSKPSVVFKSASMRSRDMVLYFFIVALAILLVILIFKRL